MKQLITIWPAIMFANKRIIKAPGLIKNVLATSIGIKITFTNTGTTRGQKICDQKWRLVLNRITGRETYASIMVKAILTVTLAEPGIKPNKLLIKMKKKSVNR